jgi:hypothetical protein
MSLFSQSVVRPFVPVVIVAKPSSKLSLKGKQGRPQLNLSRVHRAEKQAKIQKAEKEYQCNRRKDKHAETGLKKRMW